MIELLEKLSTGGGYTMDLRHFALCLLVSFLFAFITEVMYLLFYENRGTGSQIHRGFMLIGPSITLLFICVQLSLPLSLGLLGALSIVRFRTPVKEPEEVGFLMLLIGSSIGIATFNFSFVVVLYAGVFVVLGLRKLQPKTPLLKNRAGLLTLRLQDSDYHDKGERIGEALKESFSGLKLDSITSIDGHTSIQYLFTKFSADNWSQKQGALKNEYNVNDVNLFLSRASEIG